VTVGDAGWDQVALKKVDVHLFESAVGSAGLLRRPRRRLACGARVRDVGVCGSDGVPVGVGRVG